MLETLTAYLTLNDIHPAQPFLDGGKVIIATPDKKLINLAQKGYILQGFQDFVTQKLTFEEFMLMGDEGSERKVYGESNIIDDSEIYLETCMKIAPNKISDCIILIDQKISEGLQKELSDNKIILLEI